MTNLKTLRDIDFKQNANCYRNELRIEAVKWVKEGVCRKATFGYNRGAIINISAEDFIKYFFNLTKEDLK